MTTTELPYLAHGPIGQAFAEQSQDFGYLYDRGQSVAWVKSRWSVGDKGDLLLKAAIGDYCTELYLKYPKDTPRLSLLLDSRFRQGVLAEAKPHLPKWKFSERFDQDPFLLGVPGNGVVDLRAGQLREMERTDYVTKRARVRPNANCEAKRFLKFMDEITDGDTELNAYLMRHAGYGLTGCTTEHCLPFWWGPGGNGKGELINIRQYIMGFEYGTVLRMDDLTFRDKGSDNQRRVIAKLCGCRLVTANEGNARVRLDMALLKTLASSDLLSGAHLYENEFTFAPTHKLVLATNNKPELEIDDAARRRVHLVPFNVSFRGREDRMISEKLKAEAPGILHLMIQACMEWQRVGLSPPQSVTDATTGLFRDLDPLGRFMDECLENDASAFTFTTDLVKAYANFLLSNGEDQYVEQKTLITQIRERGGYSAGVCRNAQGQQMRGVRGVKIKDPQLQV
ncbi:MAG: phage/plasmid primase, P4 family [Candidatus Sulfotelmatobacter sp.]